MVSYSNLRMNLEKITMYILVLTFLAVVVRCLSGVPVRVAVKTLHSATEEEVKR